MKTNSPFILLTLSNGNKPVIIPKDNIAFAMETAGENAEGKTVSFTRVFLKAVMIDDEAKWVDVRETPKEISLGK
jgi:hypothetical protein